MTIPVLRDLVRNNISAFGDVVAPPATTVSNPPLAIGITAKVVGGTSAVTTPTGLTTRSGSTLLAFATWNPDATPVITDSAGSTWNQIGSKITMIGFPGVIALYAAVDIVGSVNHTVTCTIPGVSAQTLLVVEVQGAIDLASVEILASGTDTATPFSITTTAPTDPYSIILVAAGLVGDGTNNTVLAESTGMSVVVAETGFANWQSGIFAKTVDAVGTYTPSFTSTNVSDVGMYVVSIRGHQDAVRLGAHTLLGQEDGSGANPAVTSPIDTQANGSSFVCWIAGYVSNPAEPTDTYGNTWVPYGSHVYDGYGGAFDVRCYVAVDGTGGSNHTITVNKAGVPTGEMTIVFAEVKNATELIDYSTNYPLINTSLTTSPVTTDGPAVLIAPWWGDLTGLTHTATPDSGFSLIESFGTLPAGSAVQSFVAAREVLDAGTYSTTWTETPNQGAALWLMAFGGANGTAVSLTGWNPVTITIPNMNREDEFVVSALGILPTHILDIRLAPTTDQDENEPGSLDLISLSAESGTDNLTINIESRYHMNGPIKILYKVTT